MQDITGQSYISTVILPDSETTHYIKDAEARAAITTIEGKEAGWDAKQDKITANGLLKGNGSGTITAATKGTDYIGPVTAVSDDTSKSYVTKVTQATSGQITVTKGNLPTASSSTAGIMKLGASGGADTYGSAATAETNAKAYADGLIAGLGSYLKLMGAKDSEAEIKAITSAKKGEVWINRADNSEWVCTDTITTATASVWEKLGYNIDLTPYLKKSEAGDLAYKSSASGSFTPSGSVTIDSYTPAGSISMNNFTPSGSISTGTGTVNYTPAGSVSVSGFTPSGSISTGTGTANYTPAGTLSMDNYTPTGSISVGTGTANYTPAGSVSNVALNTTTVYSITATGTLPEWSAAVNNETLTFSFSQGTLPTKGSAQTVATTVKTQPAFTGTGAELKFTGTASKPTGSFSGTGTQLKFTGTAVSPTGTFTGTGVELKFTGTAAKPTGSFSGTAKAPTGSFSGTAGTVTVS